MNATLETPLMRFPSAGARLTRRQRIDDGGDDAGWADRARAALKASGEVARRGDSSRLSRLTSQELQIARLVAQGLSNREVAARLFLSPRTVDAQLRQIFASLGIASRVELAQFELAPEISSDVLRSRLARASATEMSRTSTPATRGRPRCARASSSSRSDVQPARM